MRIIRDYSCTLCGTTTHRFVDNSLPWSKDRRPHDDGDEPCEGFYTPEMSPTATTFTFADRRARKVFRGG